MKSYVVHCSIYINCLNILNEQQILTIFLVFIFHFIVNNTNKIVSEYI